MALITSSQVETRLGLSSGEEAGIVQDVITQVTGAVRSYLRYDPEQATRTEYLPLTDLNSMHADQVWDIQGSSAVIRAGSHPATDELQLRHLPVRNSTAIDLRVDLSAKSGTASGSFAADTQKTEGTDYWMNYEMEDASGNLVCLDGIVRSEGLWPIIPGSVKVVYVGGYTAAELAGSDSNLDASPIVYAALSEAVRLTRALLVSKSSTGVLAGPLESERLGDYSYKLNSQAVAASTGAVNDWDLSAASRQKLEPFVNWGWSLVS